MSLKKIKDNQELINLYNNYSIALKKYQELPAVQAKEKASLQKRLLESIQILQSNNAFLPTSSEAEQKELNALKETLEKALND